MDKRENERRAYEAERLLSEPLLNEALDKIERDALNEMLKLPFWSTERKGRMLADRISVVRSIKAQLRSIVLTGTEHPKRTVA